jgi:hypothetical protein
MANQSITTRDFFISRTGGDRDVALVVDEVLRNEGYTTFIQDEDFGSASFIERMAQGWSSGARLVCLLSRAYQQSEFCKKEYEVALKDDPRNLSGRVIVLRISECTPIEHLADLGYTDLVPLLSDATALREAILGAVDPVRHPKSAHFSALYHRSGTQILHPEIRPVPSFTARGDELKDLDTKLWGKRGHAAITSSSGASAAVKGMSGVGKSVLAQQYAWESRGRYQGVWWLRAETHKTLLDDLISLGSRFNAKIEEMPDREKAAAIVLDHIAQAALGKPWLLVYDNAQSPSAIDKMTPTDGAHVIITTHWRDWYGHAEEIPVDGFPREVAIEYLMARARGSDQQPEKTRAAATALAEDLGHLPLALAIARAHAWDMNWTFDQYREHVAEMLVREPTKAIDYPRSVEATFNLALDKAKATSPEAESLVGIAAFLAPDRIPLDIFTADVLSDIEKGEAVAALAEVSLVTPDTLDDGTSGISVHRIVQAVTRKRLGDKVGEFTVHAVGCGCVSPWQRGTG